jgi:hypothetical protein
MSIDTRFFVAKDEFKVGYFVTTGKNREHDIMRPSSSWPCHLYGEVISIKDRKDEMPTGQNNLISFRNPVTGEVNDFDAYWMEHMGQKEYMEKVEQDKRNAITLDGATVVYV